MAFTEAQKVRIRHFLGYPDVYLQSNTRLESAITVIGDRPETQALVVELLDKLATVETKVESAITTAGLKMVGKGEAEWFPNGAELSGKRNEGRAYCGRLSIVFGVPLAGDAFGRDGYRGDSWMGYSHQYGGMFGLG